MRYIIPKTILVYEYAVYNYVVSNAGAAALLCGIYNAGISLR